LVEVNLVKQEDLLISLKAYHIMKKKKMELIEKIRIFIAPLY
tara:strand:- start:947 stop:1072 length:126 start_codon:yes stop_codon:yes gene_type:complete